VFVLLRAKFADVMALWLCSPVSALDDLYISQVHCGQNFSVCVSAFGDAYSWGVNQLGQLMHGTHTSYSDVRQCKVIDGFYFKQVWVCHTMCVMWCGVMRMGNYVCDRWRWEQISVLR
jgi:alpha-tubulin suppressor-like RCC1 family protein